MNEIQNKSKSISFPKFVAWAGALLLGLYTSFCTALVSWIGIGTLFSIHLLG
tara:strand:- start:147 stop:302 length:156 start_codon:yes stop_codon:yes gene_type:complete